jgi:hypothetical protein
MRLLFLSWTVGLGGDPAINPSLAQICQIAKLLMDQLSAAAPLPHHPTRDTVSLDAHSALKVCQSATGAALLTGQNVALLSVIIMDQTKSRSSNLLEKWEPVQHTHQSRIAGCSLERLPTTLLRWDRVGASPPRCNRYGSLSCRYSLNDRR